MREYQEDVDHLNEKVKFSSEQTSALQDIGGILVNLSEKMGRKQATRILSILQYENFDLELFRTTVKMLRDCEKLLKRATEKFFKEGGFERMSSPWKKTVAKPR